MEQLGTECVKIPATDVDVLLTVTTDAVMEKR
jgi:hypothetical protein